MVKQNNGVFAEAQPDSNLPISNNDEKELPVTFSKLRRYLILLVVSFSGLLAPLASTIYFPSIQSIINELNTTSVLLDISISVFMLLLAIFPLIWGGISDRYSRRWVLMISLTIFLLGNIGAALAQNIGTLIAMRVVQGVGSSAPLVAGVGVVTDIFPKNELGSAVSLFFVGTLIGPVLGPIVGGLLDEALGWRSTFWCLAIASGIALLLVILFLPETLPLSSKQPLPYRFVAGRLQRHGSLFNPLFPLVFLRYPVVIMAGLVTAISFGTFFGVESFQSRAMERVYHLSAYQVGLTFLVLGVGSIVGNLIGGRMSDFMYRRAARRSTPEPEIRLQGVWLCNLILVGGLLLYGWFLYYEFHLGLTLFASFLIGFGYTSGSVGCSTYLVDLAPHAASSITASANFLKMLLSAIVTAINTVVLDGLGFGWGGTLYAGISFIIVVLTFLLVWRGQAIRYRTGPEPNAHS